MFGRNADGNDRQEERTARFSRAIRETPDKGPRWGRKGGGGYCTHRAPHICLPLSSLFSLLSLSSYVIVLFLPQILAPISPPYPSPSPSPALCAPYLPLSYICAPFISLSVLIPLSLSLTHCPFGPKRSLMTLHMGTPSRHPIAPKFATASPSS